MKKKNLKTAIFYVALIAVILIVTVALFNNVQHDTVVYSDIVKLFNDEQVKTFVIDDTNVITVTTKDDKTVEYRLRDLALYYYDLSDMVNEQYEKGIIESFDLPAATDIPWWVAYLPYVFLIGLVILLWFFVMGQTKGQERKITSFGKARAKLSSDDKKKVFFKDVAGADEEKEELKEVVEYLKDPVKFSKLGAKIPHGVLLMGPPGTGKTLLAKAVAGEAGVPFYSISGSDFVEMYVGVGASRVRDLFETAKKHPASIVFIDEIDAVGRHRGAGLGGGHDEREQTLNQLLVEMDGFGSNEGVIVIAATNRPDILDPALLRPGRFDRQITVGYPDIKGRVEILKVHARNKPFEATVDLEYVAHRTVGFTGADLANLLNEAALLAARHGKSLIGMEDIDEAYIKIIAGPKKKSRKMNEREIKNTAYHEAGHAILAYCLPTQDPVQQISIIPSGKALGYTLNPPIEDKYSVYKTELKEKISMLLGGRAAEQIIFGDISGGASNDIERATNTAKQMVTQLGMSDILGPIKYGQDQGEVFLGRDYTVNADHSDSTAAKIDAEIHAIVAESYAKAIEILNKHIDKLHFIAKYLVKNEVMDSEQFKLAMEGEPTIEELEQIVEERKQRSAEENRARAEAVIEEERLRAEAERNRIADEAYRREHPEADKSGEKASDDSD